MRKGCIICIESVQALGILTRVVVIKGIVLHHSLLNRYSFVSQICVTVGELAVFVFAHAEGVSVPITLALLIVERVELLAAAGVFLLIVTFV